MDEWSGLRLLFHLNDFLPRINPSITFSWRPIGAARPRTILGIPARSRAGNYPPGSFAVGWFAIALLILLTKTHYNPREFFAHLK